MLKIYKASAGSGKTHKLTEEYLLMLFSQKNIKKLCKKDLNTDYFKYILAITFTNKAAIEIKDRIISRLYNISKGKEDSIITILEKKFHLDKKTIELCANKFLKSILHNYSNFRVSTIDSFFQQVVKSFLIDLNLPLSYKIELDIDKAAKQILTNFYEYIEQNQTIFNLIKERAINKLRVGQSWQISEELLQIIGQFFKEENIEYLLTTDIEKTEEINLIKNFISQQKETLLEEVKNISENILDFVDNMPNLKGSLKTFYNYLNKIIRENKYQKGDFSFGAKTIEQILNGENTSIEEKYPELKPYIEKFRYFYHRKLPLLITLILIDENINYFISLPYLKEILQSIKFDERLIFITDIVVFLSQMLKNEDVPIVYERIGSILKHIMIDEFQDTSRYQWKSFIPLLTNSIAEGYKSMIVGDAKQSLYRWRNGDFRLLLYEVQKKFKSFYQEEILEKNWRSYKQIVEFNNKIFSILPQIVYSIYKSNAGDIAYGNMIAQAYKDVKQQVGKHEDGYVEMVLFRKPRSEWKEIANEHLQRIINQLFTDGYNAGDITILVRKNREAGEIFNLLTEKFPEVNIVAEQSLKIENSMSIRLIISLLNLIAQENLKVNSEEVSKNFHLYSSMYLYSQLKKIEYSLEKTPQEILPSEFIENFYSLRDLPLYLLVERIIEMFKLNEHPEELPFLRSFLELVFSFSEEQSDDLLLFLQQWNEGIISDKSIDLSEDIDAIKIMTIHKSKGLSFPVVIIPYLDWSLGFRNNLPFVWTSPTNIENLSSIKFPITISKKAAYSHFSKDYSKELLFNYMDVLNILYVGFTRPIERLYAFIPYSSTAEKGKGSMSNINDVLYRILTTEYAPIAQGADIAVKIGTPTTKKKKKEKQQTAIFQLENLNIFQWQEKISVHTKAADYFLSKIEYIGEAINYGNIMHEILSIITNIDESQKVVEQFYYEGLIDRALKHKIQTHLKQIFSNPTVQEWFSDKWTVKTEESIITKGGEIKRPDRVLISDNEVIVIDYKFGAPDKEHINQVREYMELICQIEPHKQISGYIYYAKENKIIKI